LSQSHHTDQGSSGSAEDFSDPRLGYLSQSHHTDQGSSGFVLEPGPKGISVVVAIPPYRSGQFRLSVQIVTSSENVESQSHHTDQGSSGRGLINRRNPGQDSSQSHHTDQGSSGSHLANPLTLQALKLAVFVTCLGDHLPLSFSTAFHLTSSPVTPEDSTSSMLFVTSPPKWHFGAGMLFVWHRLCFHLQSNAVKEHSTNSARLRRQRTAPLYSM
jgi:hypothetical protein